MRAHVAVAAPTTSWQLPINYSDMSPLEQAAALRSSILGYLDTVGRARAADVISALGATNEKTVRRQLEHLAATQHIYSDNLGRDALYARNGKLAHPLLQAVVHAGLRDYVLRTYNDALTGRYLTVTEYSVTPLGEKVAKSGIRIDIVDLEVLVQGLQRIVTELKRDMTLLEGKLVR